MQYHGWCEAGGSCTQSHDMQRIVSMTRTCDKKTNRTKRYGAAPLSTHAALMIAMRNRSSAATHTEGNDRDRNTSSASVTHEGSNCSDKSISADSKCETDSSSVVSNRNTAYIGENGDANHSSMNGSCNTDNSSIEINHEDSLDCHRGSKRCSDDIQIDSIANVSQTSEDNLSKRSCISSHDNAANHCIPSLDSDICPDSSSKHSAINMSTKSGGHCSGVDAFKTGYIFASYIRKSGKLQHSGECNGREVYSNSFNGKPNLLHTNCPDFSPAALGFSEQVNRIYLTSKDLPFLVRKSPFAKLSKNHLDKIKRLRNNLDLI